MLAGYIKSWSLRAERIQIISYHFGEQMLKSPTNSLIPKVLFFVLSKR
jgi:hypothetical protein